MVFAHYMLANQNYVSTHSSSESVIDSDEREIRQAQAIGIDGAASILRNKVKVSALPAGSTDVQISIFASAIPYFELTRGSSRLARQAAKIRSQRIRPLPTFTI
jgi:hypothetical protein